jgi:hypothetical protein
MASVMRIAVLADVHGTAPALRETTDAGEVTAVLESAAGRGPVP